MSDAEKDKGGDVATAERPAVMRVRDVRKDLKLAKSSGESRLRGLTLKGKTVVVYSPDGLNDTSHTEGCCCCGGNEIQNSMEINANILAYALLH